VSNPSDLDPQAITEELRGATKGLAGAAAKLGRLQGDFNGGINEDGEFSLGPGKEYQMKVASRKVAIFQKAEADGKRPPGEDVRTAMAEAEVREMEPALAARYDHLSTEIEALRQFISAQKQVISGHQSVLSASKVLSGMGQ
jgi:hypothetical protein